MTAHCSECIGKAEIEAKSQPVGKSSLLVQPGPYDLPSQLCLWQTRGVLPNLLSKASKQMKVKIYFSRQKAKDDRPSL